MKDYNGGNRSPHSRNSPKKFVPYNKQQLFGFKRKISSKEFVNESSESASKILLFSKKDSQYRTTSPAKTFEEKSPLLKDSGGKKKKSNLLTYLEKVEK